MKTQIDLSRLSKKRQAEVTKVLTFVEGFLPKDASSPWPKELRRKNTPFASHCVMAFDGTIGASVHIGYILDKQLKAAVKQVATNTTLQNLVLDGIARGGYIQDAKDQPLDKLFLHYDRHIFCRVTTPDGTPFLILAQDVYRIRDAAKRFRSGEAALVKFDDFSFSGMDPFAVLTYAFKDCPVYIHVLAVPAQE